MITMKSLKHGALALLLVAAFMTVGVYEAAAELELLGTTGVGNSNSRLVEIDPSTGEVIREIGRVGFTVNGLAWDQTNGKLYASTAYKDPNYNGLIEIDPGTGVGTIIGVHGWGFGYTLSITNITVNSFGQMYGWSEWGDDLVSINKYTGVATVVGESGLSTATNGLAFDNTGTLYMVNSGGSYYIINTSTGAATHQGDFGPTAHHGVFHPNTNVYYGLDQTKAPADLVRANLSTGTLLSRVEMCCDYVHTLAFMDNTHCFLDLDLDYDGFDNVLDMEFTLREGTPAIMSVWLHVFHQEFLLWSVGIPPHDSRETFSVPMPLPRCGNIGIMATLATQNAGIACSTLETVDTGF